MGMMDSGAEEPKSKTLRYAVTGVAFAILLAVGLWWFVFRFWGEKRAADHFLETLASGNTERAYCLWKLGEACTNQPAAEISRSSQSYTYQDFLEDWGPGGYYGPVKSYGIETAQLLSGASGVIVVIRVSPFPQLPENSDAEKQRQTKEVRIWVESSDKSLSFPP